MLDDFDLESPEGPPPEESENRTFLLVAGGLGGFAIISLLCLAAVWYFRGDGGPADDVNATAEAINARNTEVAQAAEETADALALTPTATETQAPSPTPTVTLDGVTVTGTPEATVTGGPTVHPATATVQVLLTQAAIAQTQAAQDILTVTPTATTGLPDTGFADDIGLIGMFALTAALVLVIVFARRLRASNS
ncbi:MAG: hypothetical protein OEV06_08780 [Anaerolineae bacterium]|nr:hypothetical protein [Anaerolineae bacterium]